MTIWWEDFTFLIIRVVLINVGFFELNGWVSPNKYSFFTCLKAYFLGHFIFWVSFLVFHAYKPVNS